MRLTLASLMPRARATAAYVTPCALSWRLSVSISAALALMSFPPVRQKVSPGDTRGQRSHYLAHGAIHARSSFRLWQALRAHSCRDATTGFRAESEGMRTQHRPEGPDIEGRRNRGARPRHRRIADLCSPISRLRGVSCDPQGGRIADFSRAGILRTRSQPLEGTRRARARYSQDGRAENLKSGLMSLQVRLRTIATLSCTRTSKRATLTTMRSWVPSPIGSFSSLTATRNVTVRPSTFTTSTSARTRMPTGVAAKWRISRRVPSD